MIGVLVVLALAFRFYARFLARRVARLDPARPTPAHVLNDGQNYHPTNRWVLFGHHFAAISGAGPLIGPVLAVQYGYFPGLLWLVVGVTLAGAVQDMLVLWASTRHAGRSLARIANDQLGDRVGLLAAIAILFIVIVALSGLGAVVVKALGGESVSLAAGTQIRSPAAIEIRSDVGDDTATLASIPPGSTLVYPGGIEYRRSEGFTVRIPAASPTTLEQAAAPEPLLSSDPAAGSLVLPAGSSEPVAGSSWGTFTVAATIPIALFVGLYMYRLRRGRVVEASLIGAAAVLAATFAGGLIGGTTIEPLFEWGRGQTILAICVYGFVASVLPVWLLLCPRDYLSSFLKVGTLALLVLGVIVANPSMEAPAFNEHFAAGGPILSGAVFPFVFICIMCGAISGFHALVSSGTTPKMLDNERDIPLVGYGSMLLEGLVATTALIAAASLPQSDYWAINVDPSKVPQYAETLTAMGATDDNLAVLEEQVGGESLRGRTGGAVTLAVGMSQVLSAAAKPLAGEEAWGGLIKYWYHFALMFEALFILTTIDTGTRIARFLLQEVLGRFSPRFGQMDWMPGAVICSAVVTLGWGGLIYTGSIETIWPMFGIANQLLAAIALVVVTTLLFSAGNGRYAAVTLVPLAFVMVTTLTAGSQMITGRFWGELSGGWSSGDTAVWIRGGLNMLAVAFLLICFVVILVAAISRWIEMGRRRSS